MTWAAGFLWAVVGAFFVFFCGGFALWIVWAGSYMVRSAGDFLVVARLGLEANRCPGGGVFGCLFCQFCWGLLWVGSSGVSLGQGGGQGSFVALARRCSFAVHGLCLLDLLDLNAHWAPLTSGALVPSIRVLSFPFSFGPVGEGGSAVACVGGRSWGVASSCFCLVFSSLFSRCLGTILRLALRMLCLFRGFWSLESGARGRFCPWVLRVPGSVPGVMSRAVVPLGDGAGSFDGVMGAAFGGDGVV